MGDRLLRGRAVAGLALLALLLTGCPQNNRRQAGDDPIIPGGAPLGTPKTATAINTPLPPLPAANGSTSPAALAASTGALDPEHNLRIAPPPGGVGATLTGNPGSSTNGAGDWHAQGNGPDAIPSTAPIAITAPVAVPRVPDASRRDVILTGGAQPTPAPPSPPALTRVQSFEQAQAALHSRNVVWQDLKSQADTGEWRFSCSVPNKTNPSLSRTYEGRATTPLAAVQVVLDKIDADAAGGY